MERCTAYSLYHKIEEFRNLLSSRGFVIDKYDQITSKRNSIVLGKFSGDYLVLRDNMSEFDDRKVFREGLSKLQKIAEEFNSP